MYFLERKHLKLKQDSCGMETLQKPFANKKSLYMIRKPAAVFESERNTLGHDTHPRCVCPQQYHSGLARLCCAYLFTVWYQLLGCRRPSVHVKKRSQPHPPPTITGADGRSWGCQGYASGPEWELLISSIARDGRMADWPTGRGEENEERGRKERKPLRCQAAILQ